MEYLWIDAVEFDRYGGFVLETQFVREMGQAYLLADGTGTPVQPAEVTFSIQEEGMHRFFLRTKNWCVEHDPDGLILEIDGNKTGHICGQTHTKDWYFEIGADAMLAPGAHTLKVYDTTGWYGRFACVVITNDYDFTPAKELNRLKKQRNAIKGLLPAVTDMGRYDVIVVGGGVGGVVAAITSARYGLKTALINDRPRLGGNASEEANVALEGAAHKGYHETGVIFEIKNYRHKNKITWSEAFAYFTAQEENLDVFSDMLLTDVQTQGDAIVSISTVHTHDLSEYTFAGDLFVDGTGDAWLGYYAGAAYRIGREARFQHNESFAPECADGNTMSGCNMTPPPDLDVCACGYSVGGSDKPAEFTAPSWAFQLPQGDALGRVPAKQIYGDWWLEMPNDYDDLYESEFVRDSMLRMVAGFFDWMKNSWRDREIARDFRLKAMGLYNAKRESRRLMGDVVLTENDYVEGKEFFDAIGFCGWNIDVHHVDGIFSGKDGAFTVDKVIPITPIPFGALYSKNIRNLMMVGRCISVTHIGLGPVRVMLTTAIMGQAVATAAYLCKKHGATPRDIRNGHISELQQLLIKDGVGIPGFKHQGEGDLARRAAVTATSSTGNGAPENVVNGKIWIHDGADYAWVSAEELPQSITLTFDVPQAIKQVRLTFDFPFTEYAHGFKTQPVPKELVTDFTVSLMVNGNYKEIKSVHDNFQRLVVVNFSEEKAEAVKITVHKAVDSSRAVITEVRIY